MDEVWRTKRQAVSISYWTARKRGSVPRSCQSGERSTLLSIDQNPSWIDVVDGMQYFYYYVEQSEVEIQLTGYHM